MKEREELEQILKLIRKYNLPLSPILEYAVKEKMDEFQQEGGVKNPKLTKVADSKPQMLIAPVDEQHQVLNDCSIENRGNHCYIINNQGERIFSSNGKLTIIGKKFYRINYTYSSISMNLVEKKGKNLYVLGKRIVYAQYRSPLYTVLDKQEYIKQIRAVRLNPDTEDYQIQVGDMWYGISGSLDDVVNEVPTITSSNKRSIMSQPIRPIKDLKIVDYKKSKIAVVGDTKPYKDVLKAMGGYFTMYTQWGPAWVFPDTQRDIIQAYIDDETSVAD